MRFGLSRRWPFFRISRAKLPVQAVHAVRFGADSCVDLALYGADETSAGERRTDGERFSAALVAWRMLEDASESEDGAKRIGMRSNPYASARLFVRMLKRAGLAAELKKTPERATVPCVVVVSVDGTAREVSMTMLRPVHGAQTRPRRRPSSGAAA